MLDLLRELVGQGLGAVEILDLVPDHALQDVLDLVAVAVAAGRAVGLALGGAGAVLGAEVAGGAGALGQGLAHQMGVAGEVQAGVLAGRRRRFRRGRRFGWSFSSPGLSGEGAGAGAFGQPHADLGETREHLDLLQREAAAIRLDVEIGWRLCHGTYHERGAWS